MLEDLLAKIQFWRAKRYIKLGRDYDFFLDLSNKDALAVKILKKYPGVIIEYTNVYMSTDTQMTYDVAVIANPNLHNTETTKFKNFTTAIFRSIINSALENSQKEVNENRNTDSIKFDSERVLHEEIVAVSEDRVPERKPRKKTVRRNKTLHSEVQQSASDSSTRD